MPASNAVHPRRLVFVGLPVLGTLLLWLAIGFSSTWRLAGEVATATAASLAGLGATVVFGPAVLPGIHLTTWELALLMAYMGTLVSFLAAYNLDLLERIPRVGPFLRHSRRGAEVSIRNHRWVRRLAVLGVFLFVLSPLPGSGAVGGCLVSRLLGLTALRTFLTVSGASIAVAILYAATGTMLKRWLDREEVGTAFRVGGALVVLVGAWFLVRLLRRFAEQGKRAETAT